MNKKGIAVMAILVGVLWSLASTNSVKAVSVTANQGIAWVQSKVGQAIDYDGVYGAQCVDLIKAYYAYLGVGAVSGNGKDYATNALPAGWSRVQGGSPQPGDILVYGGNNANTYGHVAIYESSTVTYHQNYNNVQRVQKVTNIKYNGFSNPYWGYIRPNWSGGGNNPQGVVDECTGTEGGIYVRGWAFDKDSSSTSINVDVYIGGQAGTAGISGYRLTANGTRDDVNKAYGISGQHGFSGWLSTNRTGPTTVYFYAINVGGGQNVLIGTKTVNIIGAYNPQGCIDVCNGGNGNIYVEGWAFDKSEPTKSTDVHVYIGGYAGEKGVEGHAITANCTSDDVNKVYGISGKHRYSNLITTNKRGEQLVTFYAINTGAGGNVYLGNRRVVINEPAKTTDNQDVLLPSTTAPTKTPEVKSRQVLGANSTVALPTEMGLKSQAITTAKIKSYKAKNLKKKKVSFNLKAKSSGNGKLTYSVLKTSKKLRKYITVSKSGKVTLKKKAKKGIYKVLITALQTSKYKKATKLVKIKVK